MQEAVSDLSKFLFLFLFFSLTKIYYPFFPPSSLMSLRVLHVLHNSTSPSQSCSCDSAGNKSKQGFNSFFFHLLQPAKHTPSSACMATSSPCPLLSDLSPIPPMTQLQVSFFPSPPAAPFPRNQAEIWDVCQCCGSPVVNAHAQAWPRPLESSFANQSCLVGCPKHKLRCSPTFSLLQPSRAGMGSAPSRWVLSTYSYE